MWLGSRLLPATSASMGVNKSALVSRVPASHLAPLALAGHLLIEPSMQTLTEADRQLEDQVVGGQDQNVAR
jgi:hypothetical protein